MIDFTKMNFDDKGLIPAIVQDMTSFEVLMLAYMNKAALQKTLDSGFAWFYSRKRKKLWKKGETSGNVLKIADILYDCDADTLLLKVKPAGPVCHTGNNTCFFQKITASKFLIHNDKISKKFNNNKMKTKTNIIDELVDIIDSRFKILPDSSYIAKLYQGGKERILKKVGEEATEVVIASMSERKDDTIYEVADLIFHLLIALRYDDITLDDILKELEHRRF